MYFKIVTKELRRIDEKSYKMKVKIHKYCHQVSPSHLTSLCYPTICSLSKTEENVQFAKNKLLYKGHPSDKKTSFTS